MSECWREIVGFEGFYEVSDLGRVRSLDREVSRGSDRNGVQRRVGKNLSPGLSRKGYLRVELSREGQKSKHHVHVLVLKAFVGPRPAGMDGAHGDGNSTNNVLSNLEWKTSTANNEDRRKHGTLPMGERHPMATICEEDVRNIRTFLAGGSSHKGISEALGVSIHIVHSVASGKTWNHV